MVNLVTILSQNCIEGMYNTPDACHLFSYHRAGYRRAIAARQRIHADVSLPLPVRVLIKLCGHVDA